jgi:hypothetical protein
VAALSYDSPEILRQFAERRKITYPLLSDPKSEAIRAFGILNDNVPTDRPSYGIPFPGTYMVDARGIVRAKFFEEDHRERYTAANILFRQFGANGGTRQVAETPHLTLTASASDAAVRGGNRVALVLEVDLKPGMHVYAPEVTGGYIPIQWTITPSVAAAAQPASYPASKMLYLKAIGEKLPVYEKRFRITRDIVIGQDAEIKPLVGADGAITVTGSFRYQACNDKVCYAPEAVPVKWVFRVEKHDSQRVPASTPGRRMP